MLPVFFDVVLKKGKYTLILYGVLFEDLCKFLSGCLIGLSRGGVLLCCGFKGSLVVCALFFGVFHLMCLFV